MRAKFFASLLPFFAISLAVGSQSIYRLQYKSPDQKDSITYDAFFVRYDNGAGFVRIHYNNPVTNTDLKVDMKILEQYAQQNDGVTDTTKLVYTGMNPTIIDGDSKTNFTPVTFWFKTDSDNNLVPWGVTASPPDTVAPVRNFLSAQFINSPDLTKELVLTFFTEKDDFYNHLFGPKARGGMLTSDEKKTRIFLMVVASTKDSSIGVETLTDARKFVQTFSDVADFLGIRKNLIIDSIYGEKYNKKSVDSILKKCKPSPADMVIFYYSGHGFSQKLQANKDFPFLDLRDPRIRPRVNPATQTMNIQDIYDLICKKGARFNLVLSDCCNNDVITKKTVGPPPPKPKGSGIKWNFDNVRALFMNKVNFSVLMTAASKGEEASGTDNFGSFFTHYFLTSMTTYLGPDRASPNWFQVMGDAQTQTVMKASSFKCEQHPKALLPKLF